MKDFSDKYLKILKDKYQGLNLTKITDGEEFYLKQILDSTEPFVHCEKLSQLSREIGLVVDIGFGGGFPILPLAHKFKDINFIGIESRGKKVKAVDEIKKELGLLNVKVFKERLENIIFDIPCILTFKAVGPIEGLLNKIHVLDKVYAYFYKGPNVFKKEKTDDFSIPWELIEEKIIEIPGTKGRIILGFKSANVPRRTLFDRKGQEKKKAVVKLSELL